MLWKTGKSDFNRLFQPTIWFHIKNRFKEEVEDEAEEVTEEDLEGGIKNEGFEVETTAEL